MNTESALLAAILTYPDEDTPRLAYADWLDEHADALAPRDPQEVRARAEFIRLQIACEGRDDDPDFDDARERVDRIRGRYGSKWRPAFPDADGYWSFEYRRGFVEEANLRTPQRFPSCAEELFALAPVRKLNASLTPEAIDALANCTHLQRIRAFDLSARDSVAREHIATFFNSPYLEGLRELKLAWFHDLSTAATEIIAASDVCANLEALDYWQEQFQPATAVALAKATKLHLRRFTSWGAGFGDEGLRALMASRVLSRVEVLHLRAAQLTPAGAKAFAESPYLGPVWNLDVGGNRFGPEGAAALANSPRLANLRVLDIGVTRLGQKGLEALAYSEHLRELRRLELRWSSLRSGAGKLLAEGPAFAKLQRLDLYHNSLGDTGAEHLARSAQLNELRRLDLRQCSIKEAGAKALAEGSGLRALTHLYLGSNRIGDVGAIALASANGFPHLRVLTLHNNFITDTGAVALANSPQMETVEELDLESNRITDVGAKALMESPYLKRIKRLPFARNKISRAMKTAFRKRFESKDE